MGNLLYVRLHQRVFHIQVLPTKLITMLLSNITNIPLLLTTALVLVTMTTLCVTHVNGWAINRHSADDIESVKELIRHRMKRQGTVVNKQWQLSCLLYMHFTVERVDELCIQR